MKEQTNIVVYPLPEKDYHGHPNYWRVYVWLLILFGLSVIAGFILPFQLAVFVIFITAIAKSWLVVANFMHLRYEPFLILLAVMVVIFILLSLFWGVYPDIPIQKLEVAS